MFIGNTIIGLEKIIKLLKFNNITHAHSLVNPSKFFAEKKNNKNTWGTIKLGSKSSPVPKEMIALLFLKSLKSMEFANNNSAKGFAARESARKMEAANINHTL